MDQGVLAVHGESEVCDFSDAVLEEYVGNLEVPVDDTLGGEVLESLIDVVDCVSNFGLFESEYLLELALEVALVA